MSHPARFRVPGSHLPSERLRDPQPLLRKRLPSRRGAMEQPNATGDGDAALTLRFWCALVLTGVATGLISIGLLALLFAVEHASFGYATGSFETGVMQASNARRIASLLLAGAFGGVSWYLLRRFTPAESADLDDAVWSRGGRLSARRCAGSSVISIVVIGMGASLGREAAPKLMGGVSGQLIAQRFGLTAAQLRLLMACGGGAGLACAYNVPLGGAFFTAEILCGSVSLATMLPALLCCGVATLTAWLYLPNTATYVGVPNYPISAQVVVWSLLAGPLIGLGASGYIRVIGWVSHHRPTGLLALFTTILAFGVLGVVGLWYPQLFGNGKEMAHDVFVASSGAASLLLVLGVLKPLMTALCLGGGASGGLFTPVMSSGAVLGGGFGILWSDLWPGAPVGAFAIVGAAAAIGSAMQAPITGLALVLELTHSGFALMTAMLLATTVATAVARYVDGYSIYSARLPSRMSRPATSP